MGIEISRDRCVSVTWGHNRGLDGDPSRNPSQGTFGNYPAMFFFRRTDLRNRSGDGNPLIYALKGIDGYTIAPNHEAMLWKRAELLAPAIVANIAADTLLDVPSSKPLARMVAAKTSAWTGIQPFTDPVFGKRTIQEVLSVHDATPPRVRPRDRKSYLRALGLLRKAPPGALIEMKTIDRSARPYFSPMKLLPAMTLPFTSVLLVDDLMCSGSSMASCADALTAAGVEVNGGICLLSDRG